MGSCNFVIEDRHLIKTFTKKSKNFASVIRQHGAPGMGRTITRWPILGICVALLVYLLVFGFSGVAQNRQGNKSATNKSHSRPALSPAERELVNQAIGVICIERKRDPKGSVPIDEMQARPSIPIRSPEAQDGAERAQRLLPIAKNLVIDSLRQLAKNYGFIRSYDAKMQQAVVRIERVSRIKPDMDARDNASVLLTRPRTISFGTIFLVGLPSDEGMISVLAHELMHIADGDDEIMRALFRAIGNHASDLTGQEVREQRAEELACDLIGVLAARLFVARSPNYEPLPRRIARSLEHNCVDDDEGDDDHLSPRSTIRALLALNHSLARELISGREETALPRPPGRR
jgi:hypothetical protein